VKDGLNVAAEAPQSRRNVWFLYEGRYLEDGVEEFVIAAPDTGLLGLAVDVQYPEEDT
jgi:hypothetical protein